MSLLSEKLKKILSGEEESHIELPPAETPSIEAAPPVLGSIAAFASTLPPTIKAMREPGSIDLSLGADAEKMWKARHDGRPPFEFLGVDSPYGVEPRSDEFVYRSPSPYSAPEAALESMKAVVMEHQRTKSALSVIEQEYDRLCEVVDSLRTERDELIMLLKELNYAWVRQSSECPFCGALATHESSCPLVETFGPEAQRKE